MKENTANYPEFLLRKKLDLLLRTGKILVESSADTSRIMRNMKRTAAFLGFKDEDLHIHISYNMLQVNLSNETHSFSKFQRCDKHGINMDAIAEISKLSWKAIREDYSLEDYEKALNQISSKPRNYNPMMVAICVGLACGGFCIQFGCDWTAFVYTSIAAAIGFRSRHLLNECGSNFYANIGFSAFLSTIIAWLLGMASVNGLFQSLPAPINEMLTTHTPWHPLMACALFIIPGVPLINFVSDMLDNNIEVGIVRFINTLIIVASMAFGIVIAIKICNIDNFVKDLSMTPHHPFWAYVVASAISAVGFSMIFNIPRRLLWVVGVGGVIAVCTRNLVSLGPNSGNIGLELGVIIGSLVGSSLISIICIKAVHIFHTPHHCLSIPSVIPMVPGVLMYRALFALIEMQGIVGEVTTSVNNAIKASLIITCIAIGVAIPNIFARKWIAPKRQAKLNKLIEERRKRGKFIDLDHIQNV